MSIHRIKINNNPYILKTEGDITDKELRMFINAYMFGYNKNVKTTDDLFKNLSEKDKIKAITSAIEYATNLGDVEIKEDTTKIFAIEI